MNKPIAHRDVFHMPCAFGEYGATRESCRVATAITAQNLRGCCRIKCTSALRICRACLLQGVKHELVTDYESGLCGFHSKNGENARKPKSDDAPSGPTVWARSLSVTTAPKPERREKIGRDRVIESESRYVSLGVMLRAAPLPRANASLKVHAPPVAETAAPARVIQGPKPPVVEDVPVLMATPVEAEPDVPETPAVTVADMPEPEASPKIESGSTAEPVESTEVTAGRAQRTRKQGIQDTAGKVHIFDPDQDALVELLILEGSVLCEKICGRVGSKKRAAELLRIKQQRLSNYLKLRLLVPAVRDMVSGRHLGFLPALLLAHLRPELQEKIARDYLDGTLNKDGLRALLRDPENRSGPLRARKPKADQPHDPPSEPEPELKSEPEGIPEPEAELGPHREPEAIATPEPIGLAVPVESAEEDLSDPAPEDSQRFQRVQGLIRFFDPLAGKMVQKSIAETYAFLNSLYQEQQWPWVRISEETRIGKPSMGSLRYLRHLDAEVWTLLAEDQARDRISLRVAHLVAKLPKGAQEGPVRAFLAGSLSRAGLAKLVKEQGTDPAEQGNEASPSPAPEPPAPEPVMIMPAPSELLDEVRRQALYLAHAANAFALAVDQLIAAGPSPGASILTDAAAALQPGIERLTTSLRTVQKD